MGNEFVANVNTPGINEYRVLLRSEGVTHMTLIMYATSREELAETLGSRLITRGDVVVMLGEKIDDITILEC